MATLWTLQQLLYSPSFSRNDFRNPLECRIIASFYQSGNWRRTSPLNVNRKFVLRALSHPPPVKSSTDGGAGADFDNYSKTIVPAPAVPDEAATVSGNHTDYPLQKQKRLNEGMSQSLVFKPQATVASLPPIIFSVKRHFSTSFTIGLCAAATLLLFAIRSYATRKSNQNRPGSVADLVRRGQLRSDRRGISTPLKYDDPFNNPMVKVGKSNSTVEMCGKVYKLAPVTLTKEQQAIHQKRRSRAYQWKRPKVFLKEGDAIPPDVDPDTVRWIPANHPFATTASDIDEDLAQNNVYQKHGVPFRIKAEHEALQKKLEALQNEQKLDKLVIDAGAAKDFERPFKSHLKSEDQIVDNGPSNGQIGSKQPNSDSVQKSHRSASEDMQNP